MFEDVDEAHADGEEKIVFRYNREERIAKAPKIVQDYYSGGMRPVRGFKVLIANKSNRFVLLALVFFVAATWIYTGLNRTRAYAKLGNISLELQSFAFEEEIYVTLKLNDKTGKTNKTAGAKNGSGNSAPKKVDVDFYFVGPENQVMNKEAMSMIYKGGEEYFRTKLTDYDIIRVEAVVACGEEKKQLSADVKR